MEAHRKADDVVRRGLGDDVVVVLGRVEARELDFMAGRVERGAQVTDREVVFVVRTDQQHAHRDHVNHTRHAAQHRIHVAYLGPPLR